MELSKFEFSREILENSSEEELRLLIQGLEKHDRASQYAKGDLYLEGAHEDQLSFHKAKNRVRIFFGGNRCLAKGTLIATPTGPIPIEYMSAGDEVYDEFGNTIKVKCVFSNGRKEVADLTNRNKVWASCTEDHSWLTSTWRSKSKERKASALKRDVGIERRTFKPRLGCGREPHAYVIGALLGDGCSRQRGPWIQISSPDDKIPKKIAKILGAEGVKKNSEKNYTYTIKAKDCAKYRDWIKGRYSHEKIVDMDTIKHWDRRSLVEFVAGVLDTDGSVAKGKDKITVSFSMQALSVLKAVQYACLAL